MDNNWKIGAIAGLDGAQSRNQLNSDIKGLARNLDKLKLYAEIDKNQVTQLQNQLKNLQVQLNNVTVSDAVINGLVAKINAGLQNVNIGNINVGNIGNQTQRVSNNITQGFQQSTNAIESFRGSLSKVGKSTAEIDSIIDKVQKLNVQINSLRFSESTNGVMNVDVSGLDTLGNKVKVTQTLTQDLQNQLWKVSNTTTSLVSTKELEKINNVFTDYTAKLAQFKSTNTNILSGLTQPLADFESKLAGLKNGTVSIDEVKNAFKLLGAEASKITEHFTGQLSKTDAAIRKLAQGNEIMDKLKASFKGLNNAPKEITKELTSVSKLLQNVKNIEAKEGRTANWSEAYRKWADEVDKLQAKLSVLQKQQANMTTPQIFKTSDLRSANIPYMQKVSNTIEKQMPELQKMLNAHNWKLADVKGIEDIDGKIKTLTVTVRDAEGALKQFVMQRAKLQGGGKAQAGLMQVGDVKVLETASQAQAKLAQQTENANTKLQEQVNKIQLSMSTGGYESKVDSLIGKTQQWVDANGNARISTDALQTAMNNLNTAYANITATGGNTVANQQALIEAERALDTEVKKVQSSVTSMNATMAKSTAVDSLRQKVQMFYDTNTKSHRTYGAQLRAIVSELATGAEVPITRLRQIQQEFIGIQNSARQAGKLGLSFFDTLKQGMQKFSYWTSSTFLVMKTITEIKQAVTTVKALDTALVDLRKTTTMTAKELEEFYYASNDVAKQMGVTTEEILTQASAWSRLGFSSASAATEMAKLSSQFKLISPGMTSDEATTGLVSVMKAYGMEVDDVLDGIMSKVNIVGNKFALSNSNIINMLQDSVSAMAEGNNTLEETIALETAAYEIAQTENVGHGFKTVALRLRGLNEETQELDDELKTIKGDLYDLTGVSVMQDANTYKSTYQILKEISEVWNSLTDKSQAEALELMFGKHRANIGAAAISNFESAERAMEEMANSAGNANAELSVAMDSIEYKANRLKETGTGIAQNLFKREDMKHVLDSLTSFMELLDKVTEKAGLFGTIGLSAGLFAGIKNIGREKCYPSSNMPIVI